MFPFRALIIVFAAIGCFVYAKHQFQNLSRLHTQSQMAQAGFILLPPAEGQRAQTVFVVAAENCPQEAAQRADRLAQALSERGIPVERTHQARFRFTSRPDAATLESMNNVMGGTLPIVFINGRAKSNPSLEQVTAEYKRATQ